jgi:predicted permease
VVTIDASKSAPAAGERPALYEHLVESVAAAPGVTSAALSLAMPGGNESWNPWIDLPDGTALPQGPEGVYANRVGAGWFETLGTRLLAGREFNAADRTTSPGVAVVNEAFVRQFFHNERPIGRTILFRADVDDRRQPLQIIGVVEDAMYRFVRESPPPTVYTATTQMAGPMPATVSLSVRTQTAPSAGFSRIIVETIAAVDRDVSLSVRALADQVSAQYAQERLVAQVAAIFGVLAVLLAGLGLYGVTAFAVTRRTLEIGIRMALGATPARILWILLSRMGLLVSAGIVLGSIGSVRTVQTITSMLYAVEPGDRVTFVAAGTLLLAVAALAVWVPGRAAARIDPADVLRRG